jgi:hypothetical protein
LHRFFVARLVLACHTSDEVIAMHTPCLIIALSTLRPKPDDIVLSLMQQLTEWIESHQWQAWLETRIATALTADMASDLLGRDLVIFIDSAPNIAEPCYWQTVTTTAPTSMITSPHHLLWHCHTLAGHQPAALYQLWIQSNTSSNIKEDENAVALAEAWSELHDFLLQHSYAYLA